MKVQSFLYNKQSWNKELPTVENNDNNLLLVFGNNKKILADIWKKYEGYNLIGATTSGNIYNGSQYESNFEDNQGEESSVTLTWVKFKKTKVKINIVDFDGYDASFEAGKTIFSKFEKQGLSGMLVFAEGLNINGAKLAEGITSVNELKIPIIGGLAADNMQFKSTQVYWAGGFKESAVVAVGFYGEEFKMVTSSKSGMSAFGVERKVTKSIKNVLWELDDKPALDVYEV